MRIKRLAQIHYTVPTEGFERIAHTSETLSDEVLLTVIFLLVMVYYLLHPYVLRDIDVAEPSMWMDPEGVRMSPGKSQLAIGLLQNSGTDPPREAIGPKVQLLFEGSPYIPL